MPFNDSTKRMDRIWAFVDQFIATETADRADFDVALDDIKNSLNGAIAYLEALVAALSATDGRYIGMGGTLPTQRVDASPLQDGDLFVHNVTTPGELMVWNGAGGDKWARASGFESLTTYFKGLGAAADAATLRGMLNLGTAALSDVGIFATAAQGLLAEQALALEAGGLAETITDWSTAYQNGTAFYTGDSAATNGPYATDTFNGLFVATSATKGTLIVGSPTTNRLFFRSYDSGWSDYREIGWHVVGTTSDLDNMGAGMFSGTFTDSAAGAPSGLGTYSGTVFHNGTTSERSQIAFLNSLNISYVRYYTSSAWSEWKPLSAEGRIGPTTLSSGTSVDFSGIPAGATEVDILFDNVSLTGSTAHLDIRVIAAAAAVTTGYLGTAATIAASSAAAAAVTTAFRLYGAIASTSFSGWVKLKRSSTTNTWTIQGSVTRTAGGVMSIVSGRVPAGATLEGIRLLSSDGVATFAGGKVQVIWKK